MTFMILITALVYLLLVVVASVTPRRTELSQFELARRVGGGDKEAAATLEREIDLDNVESLLRIKTALLLVVFVLLAVATFGWLFGTVVAVAGALEYGAVAQLTFVRGYGRRLYVMFEEHILQVVRRFPGIFRFIRSVNSEQPIKRLDSREELEHLVAEAGSILTPDERKLITHSLTFDDRMVKEIMTPRSVIDSIKKSELLGPLVLDDLHKTGHSRFPVVEGDIDHVVGMLHIRDLLTLDQKRSVTAGTAMEPRVFYVREDHSLAHALAGFLRTHHHLFVVVNEFRETVGLLSLEDVMEVLLGRRIIDEFDAHEDLRAVAARNPRGNNHPEKREDV